MTNSLDSFKQVLKNHVKHSVCMELARALIHQLHKKQYKAKTWVNVCPVILNLALSVDLSEVVTEFLEPLYQELRQSTVTTTIKGIFLAYCALIGTTPSAAEKTRPYADQALLQKSS